MIATPWLVGRAPRGLPRRDQHIGADVDGAVGSSPVLGVGNERTDPVVMACLGEVLGHCNGHRDEVGLVVGVTVTSAASTT